MEYDLEKYKKLMHGNLSYSNNLKWNDMIENLENIFLKFESTKISKLFKNGYRTTTIYSSYKSSNYAKRYAINYNKAYKDFNNSGGDCTNFVSQCLYAGNVPLKKSWHPYTAPWIRVNELNSYLTRNKRKYLL